MITTQRLARLYVAYLVGWLVAGFVQEAERAYHKSILLAYTEGYTDGMQTGWLRAKLFLNSQYGKQAQAMDAKSAYPDELLHQCQERAEGVQCVLERDHPAFTSEAFHSFVRLS